MKLLGAFCARNLVKECECEYAARLTRSQMCTQAAWPGRFWGRDGNLQIWFEQHENAFVCMCRRCCCVCRVNIQLCVLFTSFGLEIGDTVHDDMVEEQRLVVNLNVAGKQAAEVLHIPENTKGTCTWNRLVLVWNQQNSLLLPCNVQQVA